MGLEVSGVYGQPAGVNNTPSRQCESTAPMRSREPQLMSVETVKIDAEGRVGRDGRLKAGDQIVAIDGRPVSQMSILRTRAYIEDLQEKAAPTLTVARPISSFAEDVNGISDGSTSAMSSQRNLVLSALQHANTSRAIGQTTTVNLTKSNAGFGFTVTGRETAQGEGLLYIGTVKPNGVALGHLRAGGRLLEINGENIRNDAVGGGREQIAAVLWNFCESLLHGGAADKDGRLRVDDRLVGIERIRLDKDSNDVASKKISGCFKALGSSTDAVRIIIQRKYGIFAETSLLLDHHHHEAMHSVTATPSPISLRFSQSSDDKRSSITSDITRADNLEPTPGDAFDPNHIKLFQDIKHQRQTSAPPMSSRSPMTSSFHGYAQRFTAGGCSCPQSIGLSPFPSSRSFTAAISCAPFTVKCQWYRPLFRNWDHSLVFLDLRRRSQSISTQRNSQSGRDYDGSVPHPYPPGAEMYLQRREPSTTSRDRQRRKSVGRVQERYDRHRQKEAAAIGISHRRVFPTEDTPFPTRQRITRLLSAPRTTTTTSSIAARPIVTPTSSQRPQGAIHRPITTLFPVDNNPPTTSIHHQQQQYQDERSLPRRAAPDYYHMFNSWFAYSGGGAAGAAPVIKAYRSPGRPKDGRAWGAAPRSAAHFVPQAAEPSQLYANRFPHY